MDFDEGDFPVPSEQPADDQFDDELMRDLEERVRRKPEHRHARRHQSGPT